MGGGGVRGYLFKLVLGRGGASFWVDRIAPSKKIRPSTIWKDFCDKRLPQKLLWGGASPIMPPPPPIAEKEIPPPTHGKNGMAPAYVERKDCPHKNTPIGETPPPQMDFFYSCFPHLASTIYPPPPCVRRS